MLALPSSVVPGRATHHHHRNIRTLSKTKAVPTDGLELSLILYFRPVVLAYYK
jgi:hypothetical protein